jgi:hypothetical protein
MQSIDKILPSIRPQLFYHVTVVNFKSNLKFEAYSLEYKGTERIWSS